MRKVPKVTPTVSPDKPSDAGRSMLVRWFPQWWGWYGASTEDSNAASADSMQSSASPDLEEEILDVIADSLENNTLFKRDTVFGQFEFILNNGCLKLSDGKSINGVDG